MDDGAGTHCDCPAAFAGDQCERAACQEPAYYVSPTGAGDDCTSSQPCNLDYAMANPVAGSTVCLMNGDYGEVIFDQKQGEAGASVRFVADPSTTAARDENWYTNDLARPDAGEAVIFSRLAFRTLPASGYFVEVDGINVIGGNVNMAGAVTDIVIRNASVFGDWSEYSSEVTASAFNIYYWDIPNSNYTNILIENCYSESTATGVHINGQFDNVVIRNNHFHSFAGSGMRTSSDSGTAVFEGNHVHHQISLADTQKTGSTVQSVSADRVFVTLTAAVNTWDTAEFINPAGGKHLARMVTSNQVSAVVELREPLPFIPDTGSEVVFWDNSHGSCIALWSFNSISLIGNKVHDCGTSQGIGFYAAEPLVDFTITDNLVYATINQYTLMFNSGAGAAGFGDNCVIERNTLIGSRMTGGADRAYGLAFVGRFDSTNVRIRDNLFVGISHASPDVDCRNNIVYAGDSFEEDSTGTNRDNLVYYDGEPMGSEPYSFDGAGVFFAGCDLFEAEAFRRTEENLNDCFAPVVGSDACNAGIVTHGHMTGEPCAP